ncbi:MAG: aminotransferase class V-fold PLP-dependent enzyme [Lewinellaceae bacterium]|nr:aminotransferase class V-fold PLP-dependent enzyme [Phaeodactylibacter sp.]MCB0613300.1 aminotransferase class V-fold PLP-dependent enzyme [Phaeodactylibacter sp.]MCB9352014.1 aminotransferase class V-fold PLP-dependent enzyme [Lewinellaceae bacterium]
MNFNLTPKERQELWSQLLLQLENYYAHTSELPVSPQLDREKIIALVEKHSLSQGIAHQQAINHVVEGLAQYAVHTPHPMYFGLFNPRSTFPGILADAITATFNPQMAAWSHNPFANEVENFLVRELGEKFGFPKEKIDGVFAGGGAEANLTAVLCALNHQFPEYANTGLAGIGKKPVMYCSAESHHSVIRAGRICGLGLDAVRPIPVDDKQRMQPGRLAQQIDKDLSDGYFPFMAIATAGATGTGAIDPIPEIANLTERYGLWLHVDAAYGGAVILDEEKKHLLQGIDRAHSITFDAHKWLSAPMGAAMFLTREPEILSRSFRITADYMPKEAQSMPVTDPFTHSIQWSRRFTGLKLYLSVLFFGWEGYGQMINRQNQIGDFLKEELRKNGWKMYNDTELPIACFMDPRYQQTAGFARAVCDKVLQSGKAWISVYPVGGVETLRACITNYASGEEEILKLVTLLNACHREYQKSMS